MSKFYEMQVIAYTTVVVEMNDGDTDEQAKKFAMEKCASFAGYADTRDLRELKTKKEIEQACRLADEVFRL